MIVNNLFHSFLCIMTYTMRTWWLTQSAQKNNPVLFLDIGIDWFYWSPASNEKVKQFFFRTDLSQIQSIHSLILFFIPYSFTNWTLNTLFGISRWPDLEIDYESDDRRIQFINMKWHLVLALFWFCLEAFRIYHGTYFHFENCYLILKSKKRNRRKN